MLFGDHIHANFVVMAVLCSGKIYEIYTHTERRGVDYHGVMKKKKKSFWYQMNLIKF